MEYVEVINPLIGKGNARKSAKKDSESAKALETGSRTGCRADRENCPGRTRMILLTLIGLKVKYPINEAKIF